MEPTPINFEANLDVLAVIPPHASRIVEVGCSGGGLAKEYLRRNPSCDYIGIDLDNTRAEMARMHCSSVLVADIERISDSLFESLLPTTCWVFGDVLEHLYDPWAVLRRIRASMSDETSLVACIPNAQHWSVQARLNCGIFRYEDRGLMDRTHIRWFTRTTLDELFQSCGYRIADGRGRILDEPRRDDALVGIRAFAAAIGADTELAVSDATPFQWIVRAVAA